MGGGSSGSKTKYEQSPEQRAMYQRGIPVLDYVLSSLGITKEGKKWQFGGPQKPLWDIPNMPSVPGAVLRQAPLRQEQVLLWARSVLFPGGESILDALPLEVPALEEEEQE